MPSRRAGVALLSFVGLLSLSLCGCGKSPPPWGRLAGTITLDKKPAKEVTVLFDNPAKGISLTATTNANGEYVMRSAEVPGLPVGEYRIAILPTYHDVPHQGLKLLGPKPEPNFSVPKKYQDAKTSGFVYSVHEGENRADFDMGS